MTTSFRATRDAILRTDHFEDAIRFYEGCLQLSVVHRSADMIGCESGAIRLYVERSSANTGPPHGPIFEFIVPDFERAKAMVLAAGCRVVEEPATGTHCYVADPHGLVFNLRASEITKSTLYGDLHGRLGALLEDEHDGLANSANLSALLYEMLPALNWVGFYWFRAGELVLGAFQGKPACVRIPLGRGVCGTAAARRATLIVPDVHEFPGHIACDPASRSEIVVPVIQHGRLMGVLDLDSPQRQRFDDEDAAGLERLVRCLLDGSDLTRLADPAAP